MSVEPVEADEEDTFCAVVPGKHAFTLAGGIYTANCGACEPECPVEAIFPEDALPDKWEPFVKINYAFPRGRGGRSTSSSTSTRPSTTSRTSRWSSASRRNNHPRGHPAPCCHSIEQAPAAVCQLRAKPVTGSDGV